jgi:hypothetical protein
MVSSGMGSPALDCRYAMVVYLRGRM